MANTRALATAGLLLTLASGTSIAMSPQDIPYRQIRARRFLTIRSGLSASIISLAKLRNLKKPR